MSPSQHARSLRLSSSKVKQGTTRYAQLYIHKRMQAWREPRGRCLGYRKEMGTRKRRARRRHATGLEVPSMFLKKLLVLTSRAIRGLDHGMSSKPLRIWVDWQHREGERGGLETSDLL